MGNRPQGHVNWSARQADRSSSNAENAQVCHPHVPSHLHTSEKGNHGWLNLHFEADLGDSKIHVRNHTAGGYSPSMFERKDGGSTEHMSIADPRPMTWQHSAPIEAVRQRDMLLETLEDQADG